MRILFAGSPAIAVPALTQLHQALGVAMLLCKPDAPFGRQRKLTAPPTKIEALRLGIPVLQPDKLTTEVEALLAEQHFDLLICFAYGKIFKQSFLNLFSKGSINIHPSLLPLYRGPTPINSAILNGDRQTGITVQKLALKMDAGDIIVQETISLLGNETAESLGQTVSMLAGPLALRAIDCLNDKTFKAIPQQEELASYCHLLTKEDGYLNFNNGAIDLERQIRAMYPNPSCYAYYQQIALYIYAAQVINAEQLTEIGIVSYDKNKGLIVQTGVGQLVITTLQLAGKKVLNHRDFINGNSDIIGKKLT